MNKNEQIAKAAGLEIGPAREGSPDGLVRVHRPWSGEMLHGMRVAGWRWNDATDRFHHFATHWSTGPKDRQIRMYEEADVLTLLAKIEALEAGSPAAPAFGEWTYCIDALPTVELTGRLFDEVMCLVTDGNVVGVCGFQSGAMGKAEPWKAWSNYGDVRPENIIAWIAYPKPAAPLVKPEVSKNGEEWDSAGYYLP